MNNKTELQKVSEEAMRFIYGKYVLDEVSNGQDEVKFADDSGHTVLTIYIREGYYDFLVNSKGQNTIKVADLETLETVKKLVLEKMKPNRTPFSKENAIFSKCGARCDLCACYTGSDRSEAFRKKLCERFDRVWFAEMEDEKVQVTCPGCHNKTTEDCKAIACVESKGYDSCFDCRDYPCKKCSAIISIGIETKSKLADDITWAILPFTERQLGN